MAEDQVSQVVLTLRLNLEDNPLEGPGWYIYTHINQTLTLEPVSISPEAASQVALAMQTALQSTDGEFPQQGTNLQQLALNMSKLIHTALAKQLEQAEAWASKVPGIRKKIAQLPKDA